MHPKTTRRRREPAGAPAPVAPAAATPATEAVTAWRATARPAPAPAPRENPNRLDPDDLLALTQMDPAELAALMNASVASARLNPGDRVTGRVTRVGRDDLFVDLGGKSEGQLDRAELPEAAVGSEITAYVLAIDEMGIQLSVRLSGGAAAEHLEQARASGVPVEGKVVSRNTGGFEVRVGGARAFCPASQMSRLPEVDPDAFVGQTLSFRVIETGDKTVVSRRVLQEEEAKAKAEALWARLEVGQEYRGTVRNVMAFGAFVDIGGAEGLVPRREISWASNADPTSVLRPGQAIEVRVLDADRATRKLTLSARSVDDDPWNEVGVAFAAGATYPGTVVKLEAFGAFVQLAPGLQGLTHASKLAGTSWKVGDAVQVRLVSIDSERRRLELAPSVEGAEATPGAAATPTAPVQGTVTEVLGNGVVVRLADGRTGWLAANQVDLPAGTVLNQRFRAGRAITARILQDQGNRVDLTLRSDDEDADWRGALRQQQPAARSTGNLGTFADLLQGLRLPTRKP